MRMTRGAALVAAAAIAGCATLTVGWSAARGFDSRSYRTYEWSRSEPAATGDPRLDSNPFVHERIRQAIDRRLQASGFERGAPESAELLLHYHLSMTQRVDVIHIDRTESYGHSTEIPATVYDANTLVLDVVDRRTRVLVWRGWAEEFLGAIDDQPRMEQQIDRAVDRLLAPFTGTK
jgi:hypothetical protein